LPLSPNAALAFRNIPGDSFGVGVAAPAWS